MSLLSVKVKKARFVCEDAEQFNSYVTLKLQNVKSTTVTVKGANPSWEQDFLFETNDMNTGLLIEVWCKGFLWDRFLGYYYVPLSEVSYMNEVTSSQSHNTTSAAPTGQEHISPDSMRDTNSNTQQPDVTTTEGSGQWVSLDLELEMRGTEIIGTKKPSGHSLLIACRLELPFDPENTEAADLQRKLEMLNNMMDQEARAEQARRQILYNIGHSGYSEDSDYTSDLNYPVGGQGANSSASQFRTAANQLATPQRSLETSRENSYERDDHQIPGTVRGRLAVGNYSSYGGSGHSPRYDQPYPEEGPPQRYSQSQHASESSEPLFYNSRPRHYKEYRRRKHTWDYEDSQDGWYSEGYDYHGTTKVDDTWYSGYSDTEYYPSTTISSRRRGPHRRPSLERQMTLYDEHSYYTDGYSSDGRIGKVSAAYPECQTDIRYNEYYDTITGYVYQDQRYGQDDEDRQWDSGGKWYSGSTYYENKRNRKTLPQRPASSIGIHRPDYRPAVTRQRSYESEELDYSSRRRKPLQPQRPSSRQEGTGKKLPPTPTKPSSVVISRKLTSLPATPNRQLPKTRTPSEESYYKSDYNEDYNYAYRSQDNLPQDTYTDNTYSGQARYDEVQPADKTLYPEVGQDSQYGSSYVPQVDDQYSHSYQEPPQVPDTYDQGYVQKSYKDDYQSYPQDNTQVYHDAYQEQTYPNVSQPNDQYTSQANDQYGKTDSGVIIDTSYPITSYDRNNSQYENTYKHDVYEQQYEEPGVTVPSSVYDQNTYNQYRHKQYDAEYNINTSTGYQKTYPDTYNQDGYSQDLYNQDTYNQDAYNQGTYKEDTYNRDSYNEDPYKQDTRSQDAYNKDVYKDTYHEDTYTQEPYKEDTYKQDSYSQETYDQDAYSKTYDQDPYKTEIYSQDAYNKQDAYKQDAYKQDAYKQDAYKQDAYKQDVYKQDTYKQDTYSQDTYKPDTYKQDTYKQEPYKQDTYSQDTYKQDTYTPDAYKQDMYSQDAYKEDAYSQDPYKEDTYSQDTYKQDGYQQDTYKQDTFKQDAYQQDTYKQDTYQQDTYKQDTYQQDTYKQDTYRQDTYQQDIYKHDTYKQDTYEQDTYEQDTYEQDTYKQDTYKQDTYEQDTYKQDTYKQDTYKQDTYKQDTYKQDAYKQDTYKQETFTNGTYKQDAYTEEPYKQDTYDQDTYKEDVYNEGTYNQEAYNKDAYNQETYNRDTYAQDGFTTEPYGQEVYEQIPVTSSTESYQDSYTKQPKDYDEYRTPFSKEEQISTSYASNYKDEYHDQYQDYQDQYGDTYHDAYQEPYEDKYKESPPVSTERRQSEVPELSVTTPRGETRTNGYQSGEEYYYPAQEKPEVSAIGLARRKNLVKRDTSTLVQQNTDSLESRDDELKESFETAVSSISSGAQKKDFDYALEYPSEDASFITTTTQDLPQSTEPSTTTMANHVAANNTIKVTAMVHSTTPAVNGKRLTRTESYHEQEEDEFPEIIPKEPQRKDSQLSHQSLLSQHSSQHSQHSQVSQHSQHSQKPKLTRGDSYASDHFPEESYSRRGSYAQSVRKDSISSTIQDDFQPPLTRADSYQKRGSYSQNLPEPVSRAESYERGYFKDQDSIEQPELSNAVNGDFKMRDETLERYERGEEAMIRASRENSLVDAYKATPSLSQESPRGSITKEASLEEGIQMDTPPRGIPKPPADEELLDMVGAAPIPTQLKERPPMNARQRWHWFYNQIVMQLNVSTLLTFIESLRCRRTNQVISGESYLRTCNALPVLPWYTLSAEKSIIRAAYKCLLCDTMRSYLFSSLHLTLKPRSTYGIL